MIERYIFGKPIETDAILSKPNAVSWQDTKMIFVDNTLSYDMKDNDIVYGLGQNVRGINKRGWIYISNCADDPIHTETKSSLYRITSYNVCYTKLLRKKSELDNWVLNSKSISTEEIEDEINSYLGRTQKSRL